MATFECPLCDYKETVPITTIIPTGIPKCPKHYCEMKLNVFALAESVSELITNL